MSSIEKVNSGKQRSGTYRRDMKRTWWTEIPFYRWYMLREATAIFTLLYSINLLLGLRALATDKAHFLAWASTQSHPFMIIFAIVSFLMVGYHCYTWFDATPKVMPLQIGDKKVPARQIILGHWGAAIVLAIIVLVLAGI
ncbi:MAG: fumarate reductase subunit C [Gammaproteobacteria bacterium]|nr:MAG: fumarate reductase subunit C [Gammaproteobacteria bacterium]